MGTVKLEADTSVALTERLVKFSTIKVTETNFQTLSTEQKQEIVNEIDKAIPDEERVIGLDRVLTSVDKSLILPKNVEGLKSDPPKIFMSRTPAILVGFDGEPIWSPDQGPERSQVRSEHQLGPFSICSDKYFVLAQRCQLVKGFGSDRAMDSGRQITRKLQTVARHRRQLERRGFESAGQGYSARTGGVCEQ
jgi:hypothetical protein